METQTKECKSCQKSFVIEPDDFGFYEQMKVPPPTWCPQCRQNKHFNKWAKQLKTTTRKCAKCNEEVNTPYTKEEYPEILCMTCWQKEVI